MRIVTVIGWLFFFAAPYWMVWFIDYRAAQTERYITAVIVDASQGFRAWKEHTKGNLLENHLEEK